jgi:beta-phosphoglucomutase-like phosphatase (HAD superfamily)
MIRALVFDFDGLIVDTETSVYETWRIVYQDHNQVLPRDRWLARIGTDVPRSIPWRNSARGWAHPWT